MLQNKPRLPYLCYRVNQDYHIYVTESTKITLFMLQSKPRLPYLCYRVNQDYHIYVTG